MDQRKLVQAKEIQYIRRKCPEKWATREKKWDMSFPPPRIQMKKKVNEKERLSLIPDARKGPFKGRQ
jgi:hypothetical protein